MDQRPQTKQPYPMQGLATQPYVKLSIAPTSYVYLIL